MKRSSCNRKLSTVRDQRKKYIIKGVVKRGTTPGWQATKKWSWRLVKFALLAGVVAAIVVGSLEGYRKLFWENPDYALKDIRFDTDGSLTREQAIETARLELKRNIFLVKPEEAESLLKRLPQVKDAQVQRHLPNRIDVIVKERRPVAWVTGATPPAPAQVVKTHLLDASGSVFKPRRLLPEYESLPIISGVEMQNVELGKPLRLSEFVAALKLILCAQESGTFHVRQIDVSKGYCLTVTDQKNTTLILGLEGIETQMRRFAAVEKEVASLGEQIQTVNLMVARNVPVTFVPNQQEREAEERESEAEAKPVVKSSQTTPPKPSSSREKVVPTKKAEPSKPKTSPKREGERILKPFRTA